MTKLPRVSGKKAIFAFRKAGFIIRRQKGSHVIMRHKTDLKRRCVIPIHGSKTIKTGTMNSILKGAGISREEFSNLLK